MNKYKQRPFPPRMPEKPAEYKWEEWKTWAKKQIRGGDIDIVTEWEDENGEWCDEPYWPDVTIKDFQEFAEEHDVPIEDIKLVMHEGAFQYSRYFQVYKEPSEEQLVEERKKFDKWQEEYNYPEKLAKYEKEMAEYEKKMKVYEKEMEKYEEWQRKKKVKDLKDQLKRLEQG